MVVLGMVQSKWRIANGEDVASCRDWRGFEDLGGHVFVGKPLNV